MISDTELRLSFWRDGSTQAERLAAAALRLSGYEEIDPQSPLGGPDGKKDILCQKGGLTWVGAVYFPIGPKTFATIKKKYQSDLDGAPSSCRGFVFITNQTLTPGQREILTGLAEAAGKEGDILHLQQITNLLDSAPGYGVRIQFLRIAMTIEEQLSWAVEDDSQTAKALATHTRELLALRASIDRMNVDQSHIIRTLSLATPVGAATPDLIGVSSFKKRDAFLPASAQLSPAIVLLVHRLTCFDLPSRIVGQLRTSQVWLGEPDDGKINRVLPPPADKVDGLLDSLCNEWNANYSRLSDAADKFLALASFHARILAIHPFFDGNGRVARALLMQQCLDLFGKADMTLMKKGAEYYAALQAADVGKTASLAALIEPVVRG